MRLITLLLLFILPWKLAYSFPIAPFNALKHSLHLQPQSSQYNFEGIVKLSNCSGALVIFNGQPLTSKAYILTNGHCLGHKYILQGEAIINRAARRSVKIATNKKRFKRYYTEKIVYATMTGTDIALYQLNKTYQDIIKKHSITPLLLSMDHPFIATPINIISGYWERGYQCYIDNFIYQLKEADWVFSDSILYSKNGCHTIGGTSGSPIIEQDTRIVIGINNTGNERGLRCTMNNPCEVDEQGDIFVNQGASYGQQTFWLYSCLSPDFTIDTTIEGCLLQH